MKSIIKYIKNITKNIIMIIGTVMIISIPVIFYYLFSYKLKWNFTSFIETYMVYFGTVFLGIVALYQNIKLSKENRKIRNVEKIQFLPFVKCDFTMDVPAETDFYDSFKIYFGDDYDKESGIYLEGKIKNVSKYQIQKLIGEVYRNGRKVGKSPFYESYGFYLEPGEEAYLSIAIHILENNPDIIATTGEPSRFYYNEEMFEYLIKDDVHIILTFTNVFGHITKGRINFINDFECLKTVFRIEEILLD